ncbi:hypothetical protein ACO1O0_005383 [Amphichorda felina]
MKLFSLLVSLSGAVGAAELLTASPFSNDAAVSRIPSSYESAVMGRRILALSKLGELSTVFPDAGSREDEADHVLEYRPGGLGGVPIGLMDYVADCEDEGNPTVLAIKIATAFKNVEAGSNLTLSMRWTPPYPPSRRISFMSRLAAHIPFLSGATGESPYNLAPHSTGPATPDPVPYSAANLPRFSLIGYLEPIKTDDDPATAVRLATCFTAKHHDAKWWLPGNPIHKSEWARLVVTHVYWIGGFGDRAYIGWIPVDEWKSVTKEEWSGIKLPGEKKGWSEWSVNAVDEL